MTQAHTSTEQPEALRLAELLENKVRGGAHPNHWVFLREGATELRRLHARVQELEASQAQRVQWENFPAYLIDHCEGDTITEEGLQRALSEMLGNPQYSTSGITQEKQG